MYKRQGGTEIKTQLYRLTSYAYTQSERESDKSDKGLYTCLLYTSLLIIKAKQFFMTNNQKTIKKVSHKEVDG